MIHPTAKDKGRTVTFREYRTDDDKVTRGSWASGTIITFDRMAVAVHVASDTRPRFINRVDLGWDTQVESVT